MDVDFEEEGLSHGGAGSWVDELADDSKHGIPKGENSVEWIKQDQKDVEDRLDIGGLKEDVKVRPYQNDCIKSMFQEKNGSIFGRSGIIDLPCGAGKSLTGILATLRWNRHTLIVCPHQKSCRQWREQFQKFTNCKDGQILMFTSKEKSILPNIPHVLITTYNMLTFDQKRSPLSTDIFAQLSDIHWSLTIFDEVHSLPAEKYREIPNIFKMTIKMGLSATIVREDGKIRDLNHLIGPLRKQIDIKPLVEANYLSRIHYRFVHCPLDTTFKRTYIDWIGRKEFFESEDIESETSFGKVLKALYTFNPRKLHVLACLLRYHLIRSDKIIVFSDDIVGLQKFAYTFGSLYIDGKTSEHDRDLRIQAFKDNSDGTTNILFLSQVGDVAIDIPNANVGIQISFQYGSQRQELQRIGRISRINMESEGKSNDSYFYTLVSNDTDEMKHFEKRKLYIQDKGYEVKRLTTFDNVELEDEVSTCWPDKPLLLNNEEKISFVDTILK